MREKRKGARERRKGYLSWRFKGLLLYREEIDLLTLRQMTVYKGEKGRPVLG